MYTAMTKDKGKAADGCFLAACILDKEKERRV